MKELKPSVLWNYFEQLTKIPRSSGNEKGVATWITNWANQNSFENYTDKIGNVIVKVPSNSEKKESVILQAHMDMVCVSEGEFDFESNPIQTKIKDGWMYGTNTTLGADNGIGLCAAMAIATDQNIKHGGLELVFTVSEETGLDGALGLDVENLKSNYMLNLDSEENENITIGSAGGNEISGTINCNFVKNEFDSCIKITLKHLKGGHSGVDIEKNHGNAIKIIFSMLKEINENVEFGLISFKGGSARNAIPKDCELLISCNEENILFVGTVLCNRIREKQNEYDMPEALVNMEASQLCSKILDKESLNKIIELVDKIPVGVLKTSAATGSVQTSNNLGELEISDKIKLNSMFRSSDIAEIERVEKMLSHYFEICDEIELGEKYLGWEENPDQSKLLDIAKTSFKETYNKNANIISIHAGLECGTLVAKFDRKVDCISIGPDIFEPHTVRERVRIEGVEEFYEFLKRIISKID